MKLKLLFLSCLTMVFAACSSDDDASASTQMQALNASSKALSSIYTSQSGAALTLSPRAQSSDAICNASGTPLATGDNTEWAFNKFLCAGAHNTYSPDSALGALTLSSGVVCMAQQNGLTYSEAGASISLTNATFSTSCFPQEMITNFADDGLTSVTATVTGYTMSSATGWDFRIAFASSGPVGNFDLYIRNSNNVIAASMVNTGNTDAWTITIDRRNATNAIIYEAANSNTHMRIMAEGTIAANGTVGDVSSMAGIHAMGGSDEYVALRGSDAQGLRIRWKKSGQAEAAATCADIASNGATCTGVTALSFAAASTGAFMAGVTGSLALFDNNPILMTTAAFIESAVATTAFDSTMR